MMRDDDANEYRSMSSLSTLLTGVILGAVGVIMVNKDTRKKVKNKLAEWLDTGDKKLDEAQTRLESMRKESKQKLAEGLDRAKTKLEDERKTY